jgi:ABC-type nitrate/sulfonate/bicarbonate transport system substrate-binding protein
MAAQIVLFMISASTLSAAAAWPAESSSEGPRAAYSSFGAAALWFLLEKELGYFRDGGLKPEFILLRGGSVQVNGLMAKNFDYMVPSNPVIEGVVRGQQPLKIVLTAQMANFWLVARPEIRSIADLKKKTIGVVGLGGASDFTMREILKRHGLDPVRDATFLVIGSSSDRFAALVSGGIHATLLTAPSNLKAVEMGYRKLASASDYVKWPLMGLGTREEKIRQDPDEVMRMVQASVKGLRFILTQREYVISRMIQIFKLSQDEAMKTYEMNQNDAVSSGYLSDDAERQVIAIAKQTANVADDIPPDRVFDDRFAKQAEHELKGWKPQPPR